MAHTGEEEHKQEGACWQQWFHTPTGAYLYSLTTGGIGILMLVYFLSRVLSSAAILVLFPGIVAFNAACAAFGMISKQPAFPRFTAALLTQVVLLTAAGWLVLILVYPWASFTDWTRYGISLLAALAGGGFGGWIALKKQAL